MFAYFNIGLNVSGAEPVQQLSQTMRALMSRGTLLGMAITTGAWQGVPERSLQVSLLPKRKYRGNTGGLARELAADLEQDGVAFLIPSPGSIWRVVSPDGAIIATGSLAEFPITC